MLRRGISRFDLYDFFSVFLPGAALLAGLLPFLPTTVSGSPGFLAVLIVLGFVVGRAIHSGAIFSDKILQRRTHRELFLEQLREPTLLSDSVVDRFFDVCCLVYSDLDLCDSRTTAASENDDDELKPLYTLVRSYIHMDSRGRSRTFQAVYAFYRSMTFVSTILAGVYAAYGFGRYLGVIQGTVNYQSHIGSLGLPPLILIFVLPAALLFVQTLFRTGKMRHQRNYIRYLVSDFVTLYEAEQEIEDGDPSRPYPRGPAH